MAARILTLTYYGSTKVVPHYNVMGVAKAALEASVRYLAHDLGPRRIRVNAISAGPMKTLAARGISGFGDMLKAHAERAPLKRNVDVNEVADDRRLPGFRRRRRHHRRSDLRGLRLQHHGILNEDSGHTRCTRDGKPDGFERFIVRSVALS